MTTKETLLSAFTASPKLVNQARKSDSAVAEGAFKVGSNVVIRTVTYHHIGRIKEIGVHPVLGTKIIVLEQASWLACSPRWSEFLANGTQDEVEPFVDDVTILVDTIVDMTPWRHALPTKAK